MADDRTYQHWIEVVRTFRTYYDHVRIAFPQMQQIPKHYSADWASEFRLGAHEFVQKHDMDAVKRLFDGVGYGSNRWKKLTDLSPEAIAQSLASLISNGNHIDIDAPPDEPKPGEDEEIARLRSALGDERLQQLLDDPGAVLTAWIASEEVGASITVDEPVETEAKPEASAEVAPPEAEEASPIVPDAPAHCETDEAALEAEAPPVDAALTALIEALGEERWTLALSDPAVFVAMLEGEASEAVSMPDEDAWSREEAEQAIKSLETQKNELTKQLEEVKEENYKKQIDVQTIQALAKKAKSLEDKVKALVRYIRLNYDNKFMPEDIFKQ